MPGETCILCLRQGSGKVKLRPAGDLDRRACRAGRPSRNIVEFYAGGELESDRLKDVRLEGDLFCPLRAAVHVGRHAVFGELHVHIRDVRHALAVVVHLKRKVSALVISTPESLLPFIRVACSEVGDDKALRRGKVRISFGKKTFVAGVLIAVIADLRQRLAVLHLGDRVGARIRCALRGLDAVGRRRDISVLDVEGMGPEGSQAVIVIVVSLALRDLDGHCAGGRGRFEGTLLFDRDIEGHSLADAHLRQGDLLLLGCPADDPGNCPFLFPVFIFKHLRCFLLCRGCGRNADRLFRRRSFRRGGFRRRGFRGCGF